MDIVELIPLDLSCQEHLTWMFEVRSHPSILPFFFAPPPKLFQNHVEFLTKSIFNKEREFFIIFAEALKCGYCQIVHFQDCCEVGLALHPDWWGKGIGKMAIELLLNRIHLSHQHKKIILYVKSDNLRAIGLYQKFGFSMVEKQGNRCLMSKG